MAKNPAAVALGRKGGNATAKKMSPEERAASAKKAAEARWARLRELGDEIEAKTKALEKKALRKKK